MISKAIIVAILAMATFSAEAQLYRWTDESGKIHFTDTPPPPSAKDIQKKSGAISGGGAAPQPFVVQQAMRDYPVTLYTTEGCEACIEARKLLNARGVPFREVKVASEAQLKELNNAVGSNSVPAMLVGQGVLTGFEEGRYNRALDDAGYPRAGVLPPRTQAEPSTEASKPKADTAQPPPPTPSGPYAPR